MIAILGPFLARMVSRLELDYPSTQMDLAPKRHSLAALYVIQFHCYPSVYSTGQPFPSDGINNQTMVNTIANLFTKYDQGTPWVFGQRDAGYYLNAKVPPYININNSAEESWFQGYQQNQKVGATEASQEAAQLAQTTGTTYGYPCAWWFEVTASDADALSAAQGSTWPDFNTLPTNSYQGKNP